MSDLRRFGAYIDVLVRLDEIWGRAALGLDLTEAYCRRQAVTADSVANRLRVSDDTARRWLDLLARSGKVLVENGPHGRRYRPAAELALRTISILRDAEKFHPQHAGEEGYPTNIG